MLKSNSESGRDRTSSSSSIDGSGGEGGSVRVRSKLQPFGTTVSPSVALKMNEKKGAGEEESSITMEELRLKIKKFMTNSFWGAIYEDFMLTFSVLSCFQYIAMTYFDSVGNPINNLVEEIFVLLFCWDWIFGLFLADHKTTFVFSFYSVVDILTIFTIICTIDQYRPLITEVHDARSSFYYLLFGLNTTRILRALKIHSKFYLIDDAVQRCVAQISLNMLVLILFNSALIQFLEAECQPLPFHTWMYFIWVTTATVGYGDITPQSTLGRIAAMAMIGFAIITVPQMTNELVEKMNLQSVYARASYHPKGRHSKHVIICGDLRSTSILDLFGELFHEDHENLDLSAVILQPEPPSFEMLMLLRDPLFALNVCYLEGSALIESDLRRARADTAVAVFIMTNKFSSVPDEEDAKTILQEFSVRRFVGQFQYNMNSRFLYCLQLIRPENRRHLSSGENDQSDQDIIVCLNEVKMGILAKSVMFSGTNTLIMNLITSFADDSDDEDEDATNDFSTEKNRKDVEKAREKILEEGEEGDEDDSKNKSEKKENSAENKSTTVNEGRSNPWLREYMRGCDWEIYTTELSSMFRGAKFTELSHLLYQRLGVLLFAIQVYDRNDTTAPPMLLLNPENFHIPDKNDFKVEAFVIAKNKASSDLTFPSAEDRQSGFSLSSITASVQSSAAALQQKIESTIPLSPNSSVNSNADDTGGTPTTSPGNEKSGDRRISAISNTLSSRLVNRSPARQSPWKLLKRSSVIRKKIELDSEQEQIQKIEDDHFVQHYYVRPSPAELSSCMIKTSLAAEYPLIINHIIIMGKSLSNLFDLIRPLRARYLGNVKPIVILYPFDIPPLVWQRISIFESLFVIRGSPLEENDIRRAGVFRSNHIVVLADNQADRKGNSSYSMKSQESLVDSDAIFSYQCVKRLNTSAHVVVEIVRQENIGYLDQDKAKIEDYKCTPQFASGELFTTSLLDTLVCQAFYNPQIIKVINKLVSGVDYFDRQEVKIAKPGSENGEQDDTKPKLMRKKFSSSALYQIPVPDGMKNYGVLFKHLASKGMIPMGILRGMFTNMRIGPKSNRMEYVYTNPDKNTELYACDKIFVLSPSPIQANKPSIKEWVADLKNRRSRESSISPKGTSTPLSASPVLEKEKSSGQIQVDALASNVSALEVSQKTLETKLDQLNQSVSTMFGDILKKISEPQGDRPSGVRISKGSFDESGGNSPLRIDSPSQMISESEDQGGVEIGRRRSKKGRQTKIVKRPTHDQACDTADLFDVNKLEQGSFCSSSSSYIGRRFSLQTDVSGGSRTLDENELDSDSSPVRLNRRSKPKVSPFGSGGSGSVRKRVSVSADIADPNSQTMFEKDNTTIKDVKYRISLPPLFSDDASHSTDLPKDSMLPGPPIAITSPDQTRKRLLSTPQLLKTSSSSYFPSDGIEENRSWISDVEEDNNLPLRGRKSTSKK